MLTHCGGLMSRADNAGFGNKNLVSLMVGLWSISAALCNKAAICAENKKRYDIERNLSYLKFYLYS